MANFGLDVLGDAAALLKTVAPLIATALGGPLAGTAVTFLEKALDLAPGSGAQTVATALKAPTPEQLAAIKQADNDFAAAMRQLDIALDKQDNDDRASARMREMTIKDRTPAILAYTLTAGLFGLIAMLILNGVPHDSQQPINLTLGSLATAWVGMISYYFGSSQGSHAKDLMLYNSVPASGRSDTSRSNRITAAPAVPARPAANPGGAVKKPVNDTASQRRPAWFPRHRHGRAKTLFQV